MSRGFKIAYGIALAAILIGGIVALMATRTSAFGASPVDDSSSNWSTLLFGGGTTAGIVTMIVQMIKMFVTRGSAGGGSSPYEAIFGAVLSGFDMVSGRPAHSTGSHALSNGVLEWDVKFTPTSAATDPAPKFQSMVPASIPAQ